MNDKTLVSVIVIFLNTEKFLEEAILSVLGQTYDSWELLLIDDGSTDKSTAIAHRYAEQYPGKVRYLEHQEHDNRGMSASRNLGIRHAKGRYIGFLDADDVWFPHKLQQQVAILNAHPEAGMVYGPIEWWYSWTGDPQDAHRDRIPSLNSRIDTLTKPLTLLISLLQHERVSAISSLLRREVIEAVGGFEESFRGMYEDQAFLAKVYLSAPVFVASECWYRWRKHPDSSCAVAVSTGQYQAARLTFLNWLASYMSKRGVKDFELWQTLQNELWRSRHRRLFSILKYAEHRVRQLKGLVKLAAHRTLPVHLHRWLKAQWQGNEYFPPVGRVRFGSLRRLKPLSRLFGFDRGLPIDRYYIERFLAAHAYDVRGHVLEVQDDTYTCRFGGDRVLRSDVLHVSEGNPKATIIADLTCADHIPSGTFDCIILTQTLQFVYDLRAALQTLYRILAPGGVLLTTLPGISQISSSDVEHWDEYWRFTTRSAQQLLQHAFPAASVRVEAHGNVLAAIAFLHGLATQELRPDELDHRDPDYEVVITARAVRPEATLS